MLAVNNPRAVPSDIPQLKNPRRRALASTYSYVLQMVALHLDLWFAYWIAKVRTLTVVKARYKVKVRGGTIRMESGATIRMESDVL